MGEVRRCACGHLLRQEASAVDGRVLWFHAGLEGVEGGWAACGCEACHRAAGVVVEVVRG